MMQHAVIGLIAALTLAAGAPGQDAPPASEYPGASPGLKFEYKTAAGRVFRDENGNGELDRSERGIEGVQVTNGRDVVRTRRDGGFRLPVDRDDIISVIKPRGYRFPLNELNQPQFFYVHKPKGSPESLAYAGVAPTGELPRSIEFPLIEAPEPDAFDIIVFGDPQPYSIEQVDHFARDIIDPLIGTDAAFGVSMGDIVGDDLDLFEPYNQAVSALGIPWRHVIGNHDLNFDVAGDELSDETWHRVYGPTDHAFRYAHVTFIVLDNVRYNGGNDIGNYHGEFSEETLEFARNVIETTPLEDLIVLMFHIPLIGDQFDPGSESRRELMQMISTREHTLSIAAHWHVQRHAYLGTEMGYTGAGGHHHWISPTTSGSWWRGIPDEDGIPHATMRDGSPNGHTVISFDRNAYSMRFVPARRHPDHQMRITAPNEIRAGEPFDLLVNAYAGGERDSVTYTIRAVNGDTTMQGEMALLQAKDPTYARLVERSARLDEIKESLGDEAEWPLGRGLPAQNMDSAHLWVAKPTLAGVAPGAYVIDVTWTDQFGQVFTQSRAMRVVE